MFVFAIIAALAFAPALAVPPVSQANYHLYCNADGTSKISDGRLACPAKSTLPVK